MSINIITTLLVQFVTYYFVEGHLVFDWFVLYKLCMLIKFCVSMTMSEFYMWLVTFVIIKGFERFLF